MSSLVLRMRGLIAVVLVLGVLGTACGGSGYRYVESRSNGAYFKIPEKWKLYSKGDLLKALNKPPAGSDGFRYLALFDSDPTPSLSHFLNSSHPFGLARVRNITSDERDQISLSTLRNEVLKIDTIAASDPSAVELLTQPQIITRPKGTHGSRMIYTVNAPDGAYTVDQTALVDPATTKVYFFIIGCEAGCYAANRRTITEIADSWTIKEP